MSCSAKKNYNKIAAVILAGGLSSRMGRDKAFLKVNNIYFVDHIMQTIKKIGIKNIFISGNLPNYDCIVDRKLNQGPMEGVRASAYYLNTLNIVDILFIQVDIPLINTVILKKLITNYIENNINYFNKFPLPFIMNKSTLINELNTNNKTNSVHQFLKETNSICTETTAHEEFILKGVNTTHDLEIVDNYIKKSKNEH